MIRIATVNDIPELIELETECFNCERLTQRNFRYLLTKGQAKAWVAESAGCLVGYCIVLFRRTSDVARLYSIAVSPRFRGLKIATRLLDVAEQAARENACRTMHLEVRVDNPEAIAFYIGVGYKQFGRYSNYYEDLMDALRYKKPLFEAPLR